MAGGMNEGLPATEAEIATLEERRALLVERLPSDAEVAETTERAGKLASAAADKIQAAGSAWVAFVGSLEVAELAATELVRRRAESRPPLNELGGLVREMGLDVTVPKLFNPEVAESKMAGLLGALLRSCGYSQEIDAGLAAEVADARRSVERKSKVAV